MFDSDGPPAGHWVLTFLEEASDGLVQGVAVRGGQDETDGRGVRRADQADQRVGAEPEQGQDPLRRIGVPVFEGREPAR
ncbi:MULTISPECIES: hypothetical protein [Streptomyces]|uniref:hypothetical protein n=1 Tax=Streptomyces TaxID=1883 RepID=UPI0033C60813